ncbi:hypothetical protein [uncultured Subdoligranulum sp.]|uniref:hypothetical protein n=1 Tax=uncultured Subdoligranulum sp. TaxID=512298 RepID=UPI0026193F94|nr:hypothetical protein [uncultured Subdoligranulum sp.]
MKQIFSLAGWNWRLARRAYGILCGVFALEQLAVLLFTARRNDMLGMGLAACYEEGFQFQVFLLVFLLAVTLLASALLLTCVRLHRGWRRAVAVVIGVVCGVCCLLLFQWEKDFALYSAFDALVHNTLVSAAVLAILVVFSIWWALRAIRRAETA